MRRTAAIVLIALTGLGVPTALTPASAQSTLMVLGKSVGDITLGMSTADVYRILGDPDRTITSPRRYAYVWDRLGLVIEISDPGYARNDDPGGVFLITVLGRRWATSDGIAVGVSELRVQALLGKPTSVDHPRSGPYRTIYKYRNLSSSITFDSDNVVEYIQLWRYW